MVVYTLEQHWKVEEEYEEELLFSVLKGHCPIQRHAIIFGIRWNDFCISFGSDKGQRNVFFIRRFPEADVSNLLHFLSSRLI